MVTYGALRCSVVISMSLFFTFPFYVLVAQRNHRASNNLIVREECGSSISALLNANIICPDPIARQLLVMDECSPEKGTPNNGKNAFRDLSHVFVPVNESKNMSF